MASIAFSGFLDDFGDLYPDDDGVFTDSSSAYRGSRSGRCSGPDNPSHFFERKTQSKRCWRTRCRQT